MSILKRISDETGVSLTFLQSTVRNANFRYRTYRIRKRTGGSREINHPTPELKSLQRWLVRNIFTFIEVHNSVYSYRRGRNIGELARLHRTYDYMLRIDFANFFPSLEAIDVRNVLIEKKDQIPISLNARDILAICKIVCRNGHLTIGAPSSPILSNILMFDFDTKWSDECMKRNVVYSRYADDIYLSTNDKEVLGGMLKEIRGDIKYRKSPRLRISDKKTVYTSRKHKKMITGLVITSDKKISIGRKKKRYIKSLIHQFKQGKLDVERLCYLSGILSYVKSVEPSFIRRLQDKYGRSTIEHIVSLERITLKRDQSAVLLFE